MWFRGFVAAALVSAGAAADDELPSPPTARMIADGVRMIPGAFYDGRGPDRNTILFDAPRGVVVVDTGRHAWHADAILAEAASRDRPVVAIVNTHWHLDHSSGNRRLAAVFPRARVYTTAAIDRALSEDGFLTQAFAETPALLEDSTLSPLRRYEEENDYAAFQAADHLRPDRVLDRSRTMRIGRRRFDVHVTDGAVTDADVWLYDRRSKTAVAGDLVTMPAPFLDTACPIRWREALDEISAAPFDLLIPGHGEPMTRDQFETYRTAYTDYVACFSGDAELEACAEQWADGVVALQGDDRPLNGDREQAVRRAFVYARYMRAHDAKSPQCLSE